MDNQRQFLDRFNELTMEIFEKHLSNYPSPFIDFKKGANNHNHFSRPYRHLFKALSDLTKLFIKQAELEEDFNKMVLRDKLMRELDKVNQSWLDQKRLALNN